MRTRQQTTDHGQRDEPQYALCRGLGFWDITFEGRHATFKHEQGALYVAWLLVHPPPKPIHAVVLALDARTLSRQIPEADEVIQQRSLGLDEAESVRNMRRREHELEAVLDDKREIEPVRAEARRELEAIAEYQRKHPWRSRECVQKCARAVSESIRRLHARLASAVDGKGKPDPVLQAFARHLNQHLLVPSDGGGLDGRQRVGAALPGWFTYEPPPGVVWEAQRLQSKVSSLRSKVRSPSCGVQSPNCGVRSPKPKVQSPADRRPAAVGYLARFLCAGFVLALLATGCTGPRPLKGGRAVITRKPAGVVEQTLVQSENPAQATKQDQESVKVRTFTVPAGSRMEEEAPGGAGTARPCVLPFSGVDSGTGRPRPDSSTSVSREPSTSFILSAPMPVVEREETHARTELGAAQKDTARELGARLASLKGIVWVGVGLFVFGLASLVWPPLKAVIGSVTTSAALMLGGVALMVLPTLVVGNELLILGGVGLAVGAWFLAHRHGQLRGMVAASAKGEAPASSQGGC